MKTVLVIAYLMGDHVIDTERLDAASMEECVKTRQAALSGVTPVTTRYGAEVKSPPNVDACPLPNPMRPRHRFSMLVPARTGEKI